MNWLYQGKTYPLEAGLGAEGGRLLHYAVDPALECGVLISEVQVSFLSTYVIILQKKIFKTILALI